MSEKIIIGREVGVNFIDDMSGVPAKVDTGADSSAVWASDIYIDDQSNLCFKLFDKGSPYYTGREYKCAEYSIARVKSASGDIVLKYRTRLSIEIKNKRIKALIGLCDRSTHNYPMLIGRRTLAGKFLVDVSMSENLMGETDKTIVNKLNKKMQEDPKHFYENYYLKGVTE